MQSKRLSLINMTDQSVIFIKDWLVSLFVSLKLSSLSMSASLGSIGRSHCRRSLADRWRKLGCYIT